MSAGGWLLRASVGHESSGCAAQSESGPHPAHSSRLSSHSDSDAYTLLIIDYDTFSEAGKHKLLCLEHSNTKHLVHKLNQSMFLCFVTERKIMLASTNN